MKPTLDIVTITKDDVAGLAATIASTKKLRTCPGVRQIIIDSSIDLISQEKARELIGNEDCIEYFWQEPCGIALAFNLGISKLNANWVWFLNGRDEVHPSLNENFLLQILNSSQAEIFIFELELMQSRSRLQHPPIWALWPPLYGNWVPHPATLLKAELFEKYGAFNKDYKIAMDLDLWMRLFSQNIVIDMLSIPIALYDQHGISSNDNHARKEERKIVISHLGKLIKMWILSAAARAGTPGQSRLSLHSRNRTIQRHSKRFP